MFAARAFDPTAILSVPVVFRLRAFRPTATLSPPSVFAVRVFRPTAILLAPSVFAARALYPTATLLTLPPPPRPTVSEFTLMSDANVTPLLAEIPAEND